MRCKQCGEPFQRTHPYDLWELKRQFVEPDTTGHASHIIVEDAGVFCSRNCLKEYLKTGESSGLFDMQKPRE